MRMDFVALRRAGGGGRGCEARPAPGSRLPEPSLPFVRARADATTKVAGRTAMYRPTLAVSIDTETDNIWSRREALGYENIKHLARLQAVFDRFGVRPTYL